MTLSPVPYGTEQGGGRVCYPGPGNVEMEDRSPKVLFGNMVRLGLVWAPLALSVNERANKTTLDGQIEVVRMLI